ncbi:SulP family inorganic anion transporter [Streptomyces sp. DT224]|uniref:SulP family inorganic anion transporter n=1 Tax=Streptomyces sp. DT224 TaxID=3393426 RepID=UPI003CF9C382
MSAGLVTGLFSISQVMAYAAIGGFNPVTGIYAGVAPTVVGSLFSRTVLMVTTLTSALTLTSQSVLKEAGASTQRTRATSPPAVLAGAVMLLMGVLRLGVVMSFVSNAVMTGFSTGIALQIITGSLEDATGYDPGPHNKLAQLADSLWHIGDWSVQARSVTEPHSGRRGRGFKSRHPDSEVPLRGLIRDADQTPEWFPKAGGRRTPERSRPRTSSTR